MDGWTLGKKACGVIRAQVPMLANAGVRIIDENQTVVDDQEEKTDGEIIAAQKDDSCEDFAGVKAAQIYQQHAPVRIPSGRKRKKGCSFARFAQRRTHTSVELFSSLHPGSHFAIQHSGRIQCHQGMP
ncbi:hypothetical protein QR685DRAFT_571373 [Neurospora intermedia]|uniref:Uncharacterized protein n=1 Tax=Neurospora intermedia TaxID=5142 RepID=A0ABR3DC31_NEUIN